MHDYLVDGGKGLADHFNGDKMLFDVPEDIATPTVKVNGDIYFINELLQLSMGGYFIPQRYLYSNTQSGGDAHAKDQELELVAISLPVERTDVSAGYVASRAVVLSLMVCPSGWFYC
jgi:hypothetical protein